MTGTDTEMRTIHVDGATVEVWENPDVSFGANPDDLRAYHARGDWVALYNAITLAAGVSPGD